jgi:hypothetical protein
MEKHAAAFADESIDGFHHQWPSCDEAAIRFRQEVA